MTERTEADIFSDLELLCSSKGYVHVIAFFYFMSNVVGFSDTLKPNDLTRLYSNDRLTRNELSTLIGLLYKNEIDLSILKFDEMLHLVEKTELLLEEIHKSMIGPMIHGTHISDSIHKDFSPFSNGSAMREPIFYSGESVYTFQYLDFAQRKYSRDNQWLLERKGFSINDCNQVITIIREIQNSKINDEIWELCEEEERDWNLISSFILTVDEILEKATIDREVIHNVIKAFTCPSEFRNHNFSSLSDFNITNAYPIIDLGNGYYLLFQQYNLFEAYYESPFYWLIEDKLYFSTAMKNRGKFTEEICVDKLALIFGENRVFPNVKIINSSKEIAGEIDVLVVFADRAIILQAKSKRLTIEARKGNDAILKDDFKKSVQDSYDQALKCSEMLLKDNYVLQDVNATILNINRIIKEIYIFCVVSDHYPSLSLQTSEFLKYECSDIIKPPFVMDIFLLDIMAEMLQSPLHFLSYVNRRTNYFEKVIASNELVILSFHLLFNLWVKDENMSLYLQDDFCTDLDAAMYVRREGLPGDRTPKGILTKYENTIYDQLLQQIEGLEIPDTIDLGFFLLQFGEDTITTFNKSVFDIADRAKKDSKHHDVSIGLENGKVGAAGITIHCSYDPISIAATKLRNHCDLRKYDHKSNVWYGLNIDPDNLRINFGLKVDYQWNQSDVMETRLKSFQSKQEYILGHNVKIPLQKIGVNEPCPCGSGKKFKRCCRGKGLYD